MKKHCKKIVLMAIAIILPVNILFAQNTSPLCFTARNGSVTVRFDIKNVTHTIQYSTDSSTWNTYASNTNVTINADQSIYFRAETNQWGSASCFGSSQPWLGEGCSCFHFSTSNGGTVQCSGNIMSLYGPSCPDLPLSPYCFAYLFYNASLLTSAPILPATTLADYCYDGMFYGCTSLTTAPLLPATTLAGGCYSSMFSGCTSLTTAPSLPATTLANGCYISMFYGCTSLTTAPLLLAATLAGGCYQYMFDGCTSLTTAPLLPATTLAGSCYSGMFYGCTSLTSAPILPATTLADYCYNGMFYGCTSLTAPPQLPATILPKFCYNKMFYGCTSMKINLSGVGTQWRISATSKADYSLDDMFTGTGGTMNGTPSINTTYYIVPAYSVAANVNDTSLGCVTGAGNYHHGDVATLTAIPTNHYHFVRWSDGNTQNPRNITVTGDTSCVAIFEIDRHVVSSNHNLVQGTGEYDYGTTVTLTAHSEEHHRFVRWADGTADSVCSFILECDTTVIAVYDIDSFNISATCLHGTVEGSGRYAWSDVVSLSVSTDKGYRFVQWSDGNEYNPRIFIAEEDLTVEAICEEMPVVGVDNAAEMVAFYFSNGRIVNLEGVMLRVYSTSGKLMKAGDGDIVTECWPAGVYIVVDMSGQSLKVMVDGR